MDRRVWAPDPPVVEPSIHTELQVSQGLAVGRLPLLVEEGVCRRVTSSRRHAKVGVDLGN